MKRENRINIFHWCKVSKWKDEVEYHRGFLMSDRKGDTGLSACGDTALRCAESGHVILFQRKLGPNVYSYIARRTRKK